MRTEKIVEYIESARSIDGKITLSDPKAVTIWSKVEGIEALAELALNLHWSWNHAADELWEHLDPEL